MAMKPKSHAHDGNGYPSDVSGNSSSPSPPPSPRRHASISQCRRRVRSKAQYAQSLKESFGGGILLRRNLRYLLVLPLLYVCGLLMCVAGPFSALVGGPAPPGSVYRSHEMFRRLWPDIQADNSSAIEVRFTPVVFSSSLRVFRLAAEKMQEKMQKKKIKNLLLPSLNAYICFCYFIFCFVFPVFGRYACRSLVLK
jgi:hypothetical protein